MSGKLEAGVAAPNFSLPDHDGNTLSLASFAGRKLVLYFYPKDDTSGCTAEAIDFNALRNDFDAADTAVLGMSPDPSKSHARFRSKHNLAIPLVADEGKQTLEAYGVWIEKSMYGRKYMGVDRTTVLIDRDGTIAKVWSNVKVPGHASEVLEAARTL